MNDHRLRHRVVVEVQHALNANRQRGEEWQRLRWGEDERVADKPQGPRDRKSRTIISNNEIAGIERGGLIDRPAEDDTNAALQRDDAVEGIREMRIELDRRGT